MHISFLKHHLSRQHFSNGVIQNLLGDAAGESKKLTYSTFGAACTEVEINLLTGERRVLRSDVLHDAGDSISPAVDMGQVHESPIAARPIQDNLRNIESLSNIAPEDSCCGSSMCSLLFWDFRQQNSALCEVYAQL